MAGTQRSVATETTYSGEVDAAWIDANAHMNVSWYDRVFDVAELALFARIGIEDSFIARTGHSLYRLERFVRYEHELLQGTRIAVQSRIAWTDFKRIHHQHELIDVDRGRRAAFVDGLSIHVDLGSRRSCPVVAPEVREVLGVLALRHAALPAPEGIPPRDERHRFGS